MMKSTAAVATTLDRLRQSVSANNRCFIVTGNLLVGHECPDNLQDLLAILIRSYIDKIPGGTVGATEVVVGTVSHKIRHIILRNRHASLSPGGRGIDK